MRKIYFFLLTILFFHNSNSQAPYIAVMGGDGLGQYGYLEKDAVTFARLERNTYDNIAYLSARWWITDNNSANGDGKEYIYHVYNGPDWVNGIGWQCGGDNYPSKRTTDYNAADFSPEWDAGSDCYVSVCAKYCDDSYSPASFDGITTNGAVGFNERHFRVLDVDTSLHVSTAVDIPNTNGICQLNNAYNVAGSFTISPGAFTGISLTRLVLINSGSAQESTNIPNTALNVYYEPATGSEVYGDGNEIYAGTLSGDWDGNAGDNIYGSASLNIPLDGKVRIYVLLCSFNSPSAMGRTINFSIINDGISLSPALDGFTKLRINSGSISQRNITLPTRFLQLNGTRDNDAVQLKWTANLSSTPAGFVIQQSFDGINFSEAGTVQGNNFFQQKGQYQFAFNSGAEYFRVIASSANGATDISNIIHLRHGLITGISLLQNPVSGKIILQNKSGVQSVYATRLFDAAGRLLMNKNIVIAAGRNEIDLPANIPSSY